MNAFTEEQAKTKWCPFARVAVEGYPASGDPLAIHSGSVASVNRDSPSANTVPTAHCYCIGSACMAWRWNESDVEAVGFFRRRTTNDPPSTTGLIAREPPPGTEGWMKTEFGWERERPDRKGHCGLAGKL